MNPNALFDQIFHALPDESVRQSESYHTVSVLDYPNKDAPDSWVDSSHEGVNHILKGLANDGVKVTFKQRTDLLSYMSQPVAVPFFDGSTNELHLLLRALYDSDVLYFHSVLHEASHATGRNEDTGGNGRLRYAFRPVEECTAELSTAILLNELGLWTPEVANEVAYYVQQWSKNSRIAEIRTLFEGVQRDPLVRSQADVLRIAATRAIEASSRLLRYL